MATPGNSAGSGADPRSVLRVADVMEYDPTTVHEDMAIEDVIRLLVRTRRRAVVVTDGVKPVGLLTERDLVVRLASGRPRMGTLARQEDRARAAATVGDLCSRPVVSVTPDTPLGSAVRELIDRDLGQVVVADGDELRGLLRRADVVRTLEQLDLDRVPARRSMMAPD